MTSVGFGDFNAKGNSFEQVMATSWMIGGFVIQSIIIGYFI